MRLVTEQLWFVNSDPYSAMRNIIVPKASNADALSAHFSTHFDGKSVLVVRFGLGVATFYLYTSGSKCLPEITSSNWRTTRVGAAELRGDALRDPPGANQSG
jgi:hypothetical protein